MLLSIYVIPSRSRVFYLSVLQFLRCLSIHSMVRTDLAKSSRSGDQSSFSSSHPALALFAVVVCHPVRKDDCSQELLHSYSSFSRDIPEFPVDVSLNCLHELDVQSSLPIGVFRGLGVIGQRPQLPPYVGFCVLSGGNCRNSRHVRLSRSEIFPQGLPRNNPEGDCDSIVHPWEGCRVEGDLIVRPDRVIGRSRLMKPDYS